MGCAPLDYDRVTSGTQSAAERRANEEDRTLANIITSPQERLDMERAEAQERTRQAKRDLEITMDSLRQLIYTTNESVSRLDGELTIAITERDDIWREKVLRPAASSPTIRRGKTPATHTTAIPENVNPNDYERFLSACRRCDSLSQGLALLQNQHDFFKTYRDTLVTTAVLQEGADVLKEVQSKFNLQDARALHEQYDKYTHQLHDIMHEFARLHQTSVIGAGEVTPTLQASPQPFRLQDAIRLKRELVPVARIAAVAPTQRRLGPGPPPTTEPLVRATELDSQ